MATKEVDSELTTAMQRSIAAVSLVQAFGREAMEYERFAGTVRHSVATWLRLHWQEVTYWLIIGSIFGLGGALIFGYGGLLIYKGVITVGDLTVFSIYLSQLYAPLNKLSASGTSLQGGLSGVRRVFEVLDREEQIRDEPGAAALPLAKRVSPWPIGLARCDRAHRAGPDGRVRRHLRSGQDDAAQLAPAVL
jgi:subfamily B ATP-binding cassette protein MsbA